VCARVGWRFMFQLPMSARRVVSFEGLDRLAERPGNTVFLKPGARRPSRLAPGNWPLRLRATGVSADYDGLLEMNRFLHEEVSIVYE